MTEIEPRQQLKRVLRIDFAASSCDSQSNDNSSTTRKISWNMIDTPIKKTSPATQLASRITIALIAVLIYIVLMAVTGSAVYAIHGRPAVTTDVQGVKPGAGVCPQAICPAIPACQEAFWMECEPKPTAPPCFTTLAPYCQASCQADHICLCPTASPCPTVRPTPAPPSIDVFLTSRRHTKSVSQWLNFYPPFSKNRLTVVTTLLDEALEPWALAGYLHRCADSPQHPRHETTCGFCGDRYAYVDCVMSSNLIEETSGMAAVDQTWVNQPEFTAMRGQLPNIVYHMRDPHHFEDILNAIGRAVNSFTVRTDAGKSCRVCTDFSKRVYDKCFSEADKRYPL
ncbi:hypothetical protein OUZ56_019639 [Daphnia magna]|uniref:Uncharacterized protein n=1 Tax=Daphnia magna TaxID=35525 RepID=A0ABQ9ZC72_9CRUS|nr:hypothetical protein OUZ56_019639 [Daphnia magna]